MTTYNYRLTLNDGEAMAIEAAIDFYLKHCECRLSAGPKAPYWTHLRSLEGLRERLNSDATQTSTYHYKDN